MRPQPRLFCSPSASPSRRSRRFSTSARTPRSIPSSSGPARGPILFVTHGADDHVPLVARELESRGAEFVRFDTELYPTEAAVELGIEGGNPRVVLRLGGSEIEGESVAAVLYRHLRLPAAEGALEPDARLLAESELRALSKAGCSRCNATG